MHSVLHIQKPWRLAERFAFSLAESVLPILQGQYSVQGTTSAQTALDGPKGVEIKTKLVTVSKT
jgi:hypothetical protein